jgi:LPS export ABC transporter protein LptC
MSGAPIIPCFMIRQGARFRLVFEPPVAKPQAQNRTEAVARLTQDWSRVVEAYIRRYPDQWVWMHRRWKTRPKSVEGSELGAGGEHARPEPRTPDPEPRIQAMAAIFLATCILSLATLLIGCGPRKSTSGSPTGVTPDPNADQRMTEFTLAGYEPDGSKKWELVGEGASVDNDIVTIHKPNGVGREPGRTAYLTADAAQMRQKDRHVRLEHNVVVHTSDGLWLSTPLLHWIPDQNQVATESPVRLETGQMLLRGRGARGLTQLKQATIFKDVELILNPGDSQLPGGSRKHVRITCDGPLSFDYDNEIATFENNVHIEDPGGDLHSDKLVAYLDGTTHTIRYAEAVGRVRIIQNQNTASGERAVYEPNAGTFSLVGQPSLLIYPDGQDGAKIPMSGLIPQPTDPPKP